MQGVKLMLLNRRKDKNPQKYQLTLSFLTYEKGILLLSSEAKYTNCVVALSLNMYKPGSI